LLINAGHNKHKPTRQRKQRFPTRLLIYLISRLKLYASITVIGRDQSGVVAKVTSFLFVQRTSIEGLEEKVTRGQFGMTIQASWSKKDCDVSGIRKGLTAVARAGMALSEIIAASQKFEAKTLVKAIKLYLTKRLDVYWGTVKEV